MFGMIPKKRNPFGMPEPTVPGIGGGILNAQNSPVGAQMPQQAPEPQKGGFFKPGGVGRAIAGTFGDLLLQNAEMDPIYQPAQQREAMLQAQAQRDASLRQAGLEDYAAKKQIDQQYPNPEGRTSLQQNYDWLVSQGRTKEANSLIERMTDNSEYRVGPDGRFYRVDRTQPEVLGADLPEGWTIEGEGGATPGGSPTFREAFADYAR